MSPVGQGIVRAGVVGHPVGHSLSPLLHSSAYGVLGLTHWTYEAHDVAPGGLAAFLRERGEEWVGLSVTMPHKFDAARLAAGAAPSVELTGVANTLIRARGGWWSHNTDIDGIIGAVGGAGLTLVPTTMTILGTGATARSACAAALSLRCPVVTIVGRNQQARRDCRLILDQQGIAVHEVEPADAEGLHRSLTAGLIVATLPAGVADAFAPAVPSTGVGVLLDVVYRPWPTPLAHRWAGAGGVVVPGVDMLVHQACAQVLLMTGQPVDAPALMAAARAAAAEPLA